MNINPAEFKILVVDDVVANVILLKALLSREGYKIVTATSGEDAINKLPIEKPDVILLDVMMPGMSGFEVAEKIKKMPEFEDVQIIFLTALNSPADIVKGFKLGASDFVTKPFNREELIIRLTHQISLVAAKRIIEQQTDELKSTISGRDKLYSVIAHDLRSPLGSIKMVLNMLVTTLVPESIGDEMFQLMKEANHIAEDTFSLLDNLLKWTKSQTGKLNIVYQDIDVVDILDDIVEIFKLNAQLKEIQITYKSDVHVTVRTDVDIVKTIMRNLLSNAIKYSNKGTSIDVTTEDSDGFAIVHVADHGLGISKAGQDKLFKQDAHFTTFGTANEEGSGLGLILVKDFVDKIGGKIWFESEEGKGSTFSFSIPKATDTPL
jgi:two-component system, sensor histidine kinase and response regulator